MIQCGKYIHPQCSQSTVVYPSVSESGPWSYRGLWGLTEYSLIMIPIALNSLTSNLRYKAFAIDHEAHFLTKANHRSLNFIVDGTAKTTLNVSVISRTLMGVISTCCISFLCFQIPVCSNRRHLRYSFACSAITFSLSYSARACFTPCILLPTGRCGR